MRFAAGCTVSMTLATLMTYFDLWSRLGNWGSAAYIFGLICLMFSSVTFEGGKK